MDIMKEVNCCVCGKQIRINKLMYNPPILRHNNYIDEGFYNNKLQAYVCPNCFGRVKWTREDLRTLQHDWGYKRRIKTA